MTIQTPDTSQFSAGAMAMTKRAELFRRQATDAIAQQSGPDAAETVVRLYTSEMQGVEARLNSALSEASQATRDARLHHQMTVQTHKASAVCMQRAAQTAAEVCALRDTVGQVRALADRSTQSGVVSIIDLMAVLTTEPPMPAYTPIMTGFVASEQFRAGQFRAAADRTTTFVFPFIGYALVDHGVAAGGSLEPVFLVQDRCLPRSVIELERSTVYEYLLPWYDPQAAAAA